MSRDSLHRRIITMEINLMVAVVVVGMGITINLTMDHLPPIIVQPNNQQQHPLILLHKPHHHIIKHHISNFGVEQLNQQQQQQLFSHNNLQSSHSNSVNLMLRVHHSFGDQLHLHLL